MSSAKRVEKETESYLFLPSSKLNLQRIKQGKFYLDQANARYFERSSPRFNRSVLFLVITIQISTHTFLDIRMLSNSKISYSSSNQISSPRAEWNIVESPPFSEILSPSVETERQTARKVTTRGKSRLLSPHNKDNDTSATSLVCMHLWIHY